MVSLPKSDLTPKQVFDYISITFDLSSGLACPAHHRIQTFLNLLKSFSQSISSFLGCSLAADTGTNDIAEKADLLQLSAHAPSIVCFPQCLESTEQPTSSTSLHHTGSPVSPGVVVPSAQPDSWNSSASAIFTVTTVHRYIDGGVVSPPGSPAGGRVVDSRNRDAYTSTSWNSWQSTLLSSTFSNEWPTGSWSS